jgi:hypothetical protein
VGGQSVWLPAFTLFENLLSSKETSMANDPISNTGNGQGTSIWDQMVNGLSQAIGYPAEPPTGAEAAIQDANKKAGQFHVNRTPWIMYTTQWLTTQEVLAWSVNPEEVTWSMPQRSVHSKNMFGTVMHVWPDSGRGTLYDEPVLTFKLQSGNIMPTWIGGIVPKAINPINPSPPFIPPANLSAAQQKKMTDNFYKNRKKAPKPVGAVYTEEVEPSNGIVNFYDFMKLVDAPKITTFGELNWVYIHYKSNLFPDLVLKGMFDSKGVHFTDSSQSPNQVMSWTADFIVYDSSPRLSLSTMERHNQELLNIYTQARIKKGSTNLLDAVSNFFGEDEAPATGPGGNSGALGGEQ